MHEHDAKERDLAEAPSGASGGTIPKGASWLSWGRKERDLAEAPSGASGGTIPKGASWLSWVRKERDPASQSTIPMDPSWLGKARAKIQADPALIRGMHMQDLLHGFATVLGSSQGTAATYNLSSQLNLIQTFLSHNWSTPRWHKFLVLVYHYNRVPAFLVMLLVSCALFAMMTLELLPNLTVVGVVSSPEDAYTRGIFCLPLGTLAFFVTIFGWHEVTRTCCRSHRHTMFLDKTCINQVDPDLKIKGIESLAAFLSHSGEMLVVFNDTYMQKLWTVYEIATWLMLNKGARMVVRPTSVPRLLLGSAVALLIYELVWLTQSIMGYTHPETMTPTVRLCLATALGIPAFTFLVRILARYHEDRERIREHLANFKLGNAKCFCEDDRRVVQENIVAFMKFSQTCAPDASAAEAVEAFEALARREVPKAVESLLGRVGIPYGYIVAANLPRLLVHMDIAAGYLVDAVPAYEAFWWTVDGLFDYLVLLPLLGASLLFGLRRCKLLRSCGGSFLLGTAGYIGLIGSVVVFNFLTSMLIASPVWLAVALPLRALVAGAVYLLFRPERAAAAAAAG